MAAVRGLTGAPFAKFSGQGPTRSFSGAAEGRPSGVGAYKNKYERRSGQYAGGAKRWRRTGEQAMQAAVERQEWSMIAGPGLEETSGRTRGHAGLEPGI